MSKWVWYPLRQQKDNGKRFFSKEKIIEVGNYDRKKEQRKKRERNRKLKEKERKQENVQLP